MLTPAPLAEPPSPPVSLLSSAPLICQSCHFRKSPCQERKFYGKLCERKTLFPSRCLASPPPRPCQEAPPLNKGDL